MSLLVLAATVTLLKGDLPQAAKVAKLGQFLAPKPDEVLALDAAELRDLKGRIPPERLRGKIEVKPPKGVCFTIQRSEASEDVYVCKRQFVGFTYNDLDKDGRLHWKISTGEGDFGTEVFWRSPYRVAITTPFDQTLNDPPVYKFIDRCEAKVGEGVRRITVHLITGENWVIRFPATDVLLEQPDPLPNLYIVQVATKRSVKDAAEDKNREEAQEKEKEEKKEKEDEEGEGKAQGAPPAPAAKIAPQESDDRSEWSLSRRGSFTMNASNFQPFGSVAPGMKGECRYNFHGSETDPDTGRLECHDVDGFKQVYMPLTCIGELGSKK